MASSARPALKAPAIIPKTLMTMTNSIKSMTLSPALDVFAYTSEIILRMRTPSVLLVLLLATFTAIVQTQEPRPASPGEWVKQGRELNNQGKHDEALALYRKALQADPNQYDAHLATGITLDLKGEYEEARQHIAKAIELASSEQKPRALRTMGVAYAFVRQPKQSEKFHKQVFDAQISKSEFTDAAETANELARLLLESGDIDGAYKWYQTGYDASIKDKSLPQKERSLWDFRWHHAAARIAARRGKRDEAKRHVDAAKSALDKAENPQQAQYFPYLTGYVAFYTSDYKTAIADFGKANQNDPFILAMLAQSHEKSGDKAKADELYRKVLTFNNHNPTNAYARPVAKEKLGMKI
jgi:tetratricopeptide (TPR) repeat protein